jgi:hypothetical protein
MSLNEAWLLACLKLWGICKEYDREIDNVTVWDGFKLLYLECIPPNRSGRRVFK